MHVLVGCFVVLSTWIVIATSVGWKWWAPFVVTGEVLLYVLTDTDFWSSLLFFWLL
jgi:hypothetical protein